jgi:hypothetical protein
VRLRITSPQGDYATFIHFPDVRRLSGLRIDGREVPPGPALEGEQLQILYFGLAAHGAELEFTIADTGSLRLKLRSNILGLPPPADGVVPVRAAHMMPAGQFGDVTRLQRSLRF